MITADIHAEAASAASDTNAIFGLHQRLGLWVTARCPLRCGHCMFGSQLENRDVPALEDLLDWLNQAALTKRVRLVSLTGGEAFCVFDKLRAVIAHGAALGMRMNVVTNAYWADSQDRARQLLSELQGLTDLCISVDEFHDTRVPVDSVINAALMGQDLGLRVMLAVSHCRIEDYWEYKQQLEQRVGVPIPIFPVQIVRQGNAQRLRSERFDLREYIPRGMCPGVSVPMIDKLGVVYACCEPPLGLEMAHNPLVLGDLRQESLSIILARAEANLYLQALRVWGPGYLAQRAIELGYGHKLRRRYPKDSICEVCYDLLQDEELVVTINKDLERPNLQQEIAARRRFFFCGTARQI